MAIVFGPVIAAMLLTQIPGGVVEGKILDAAGVPVAGAEIVFYSPPPTEGQGGPVQVSTQSDAAGHYRLEAPAVGQIARNPIKVWAYKPGLALGAGRYNPGTVDMALQQPAARHVEVVAADGQPVAGALVSPRIVVIPRSRQMGELPEKLASSLAVRTGPDGLARIGYLAADDVLSAVRIEADSCGTQELELAPGPLAVNQGSNIRIRLASTFYVSGHVRDVSGRPRPDQIVEVWSQGGLLLPPSRVTFPQGPLRTDGNGTFRTPDGLFVGARYRIAVREHGFEPVYSRWLSVDGKPHALPFLTIRPLRTIRGLVRNRQGSPLKGVEVFQSGDGPERTATRTDEQGRFALGGFRSGSVFLFARMEGYRFLGQVIGPDEHEVVIELVGETERPTREMRLLPPPIPDQQSRDLARGLILPYCQDAVARNDRSAIEGSLYSLAAVDADAALELVEPEPESNKERVAPSRMLLRVRQAAASGLVSTDPERAVAMAESIESAAGRLASFVAMIDALPREAGERKLAWTARADKLARQAKSQYYVSRVAQRWLELGRKTEALALLIESLRMKPETQAMRGSYASRLALVDLPAALAIARGMPSDELGSSRLVQQDIAWQLAGEDPAAAERVLRLTNPPLPTPWFQPGTAMRMARVDPERALRLTEESQRLFDQPWTYFFLATGLQGRDPQAARAAFRKGLIAVDRRMEDGVEYSALGWVRGVVLPVVEEYDPTLVPEVFWRAVATRPCPGNPRATLSTTPVYLSRLLAFYDREAAKAVLEPVLSEIEQATDAELAGWGDRFLSWALIDPQAAVERLERVPIAVAPRTRSARTDVADFLGRSHESRCRRVFSDLTDIGQSLSGNLR